MRGCLRGPPSRAEFAAPPGNHVGQADTRPAPHVDARASASARTLSALPVSRAGYRRQYSDNANGHREAPRPRCESWRRTHPATAFAVERHTAAKRNPSRGRPHHSNCINGGNGRNGGPGFFAFARRGRPCRRTAEDGGPMSFDIPDGSTNAYIARALGDQIGIGGRCVTGGDGVADGAFVRVGA